MKRLIIVAVLLLAIIGCSEPQDSLTDYTCSDVQFVRVERETKVCNTTQYLSDYCFRSAMERNCTRRKP